jgi:hypothetical protein
MSFRSAGVGNGVEMGCCDIADRCVFKRGMSDHFTEHESFYNSPRRTKLEAVHAFKSVLS